jgi:PhnB protein
MKLNAYLNYGGNCREAFEYYAKHLGGKITMMLDHKQQPGMNQVPAGWQEKIMYASMELADTEIKASDVPPERFEPMRSVYLCMTLDSIAEAERVHAALAEGGQIFMPMEETFFAHRFSMLRDRFGTSWMVIHQKPMPGAA